MTLLEALVALVILGASAAGFLGVFQSGARSVQSAREWNVAAATASSALEEVIGSLKEANTARRQTLEARADERTRVMLEPWSANVDKTIIQVTLPDGRTLTVQRLVRRP